MTNALGIDVSDDNGPIDWHQYPDIAFAAMKCMEGPHDGQGIFYDPTFAGNWQATREVYGNKAVRLSYGFLHPAADPVYQADALTEVTREHGLQYGDVFMWDLEAYKGLVTPDGIPPAEVAQAARRAAARVNRNAPHCRCVFYLSPNTAQQGCAAGLERWGLFVANWDVASPEVPAPWRRWRLWQKSGTAPVDRDEFNGDRAALYDWAKMPADRR